MFALLLPIVEGWMGPNLAKYAKPLIWIVLAVLILLALWGGKCAYDRNLISSHDARQDAANSKADKKADDNSAVQRVTDVTRAQDEKTQTQEAINEARRSGADPRAAYYQCVQRQQSARRAGQPSPKC